MFPSIQKKFQTPPRKIEIEIRFFNLLVSVISGSVTVDGVSVTKLFFLNKNSKMRKLF